MDSPSVDSPSNTPSAFGPETVTFSGSPDNFGSDALLQNQHTLGTGTFVDVLADAPALSALDTDRAAGAVESIIEAPSISNKIESATGDTPTNDGESNSETQRDPIDAAVMRELVFVDANVTDYERLIDDLQGRNDSRTIEVVVLESDRDGIGQVTEILSERSNLAAVHFITHGTDGQINLGNSLLNSSTLEENNDAVAGWGNALTETGDILFYGCDFASNTKGQTLVESLANLTGADVAASNDDTGHAIFNADWDLEYKAGEIETAVAFSRDLQDNWGHLLNVDVDATSTGTSTGGDFSVLHTTSGTDRLMLVGVSMNLGGSQTVSSVTYNGDSLSLVGVEEAGDARIEIWALLAPDVGTFNVDIAFSSPTDGNTAGVMTFIGVDQSTPLGAFASDFGYGESTASTTVSSAPDELVFGVVSIDDPNFRVLTEGAGQTERWELDGFQTTGGGSTAPGAESVNMSWTWPASDNWAAGGVSIKPAVENTAPTTSGIIDFSVNEDIGLSFIDLKAIFDDAEDTDSALIYTIENNSNPGLFDATTINASGVLTLDYAADQNGSADITIRATDTGGLFVETSFTVTVNPVNDAPVLLTGSVNNLTVNEDSGFTSLGLGSVTYGPGGGSDESGQTLSYQVTAIPADTSGDIFLSDGTTRVTTGSYTLADIQGMQFKPAVNASGTTAFQFNVYDSGGTANGGVDNISQFILITINPVNDDPTNAGTMPTDLLFLQDTQGKLDLSAIDLSDIDANGGDLTLMITSDAGHLQTLGGVGLTKGGSQSQLILTGSLTNLNNFLNDINAIDYEHATPGTYGDNVDLITIEINDNGNTGSGVGGTITLGTINIDIDPVAPQIDLDADDSAETGINFTTTWTQGGGQINIADTDAVITDADSATLQSLTVTLTNHLDGADERMVADTSGTSISVSYASGAGAYYVYLTGNDTVTNYEQVLKSIIYDNTSATPDPTTRAVTVEASDGTNVSTVATTTINMTITNVAPVITSNGGGDGHYLQRWW